MIQRDYVLRLIAEAARAVALALGLRQRGDEAAVAGLLDTAARNLTGQPLGVLAHLDGDALRALCSPRGAFVPDLAVAVADVLHASGDAARARMLYAAAHAAGAALPLHAFALVAPSSSPEGGA